MAFVKLDTSILDSSIWQESPATIKAWITLLAMADPEGFAAVTAPGLSRRAWITIDEAREALRILSGPDEESRSPAHEGRRIERVDGGFSILNYRRYREKDHTAAARMRRWRASQSQKSLTRQEKSASRRNVTSRDVTLHKQKQKQKQKQTQKHTHNCESVGESPIPHGGAPTIPERPARQARGPSGAVAVGAPKSSWAQEAIDDWTARYGRGSGGGRVTAGLKRIVDANGWDKIRPAWQRYLAETTHPSPSAQDFAAHFGDWLGTQRRGTQRRNGSSPAHTQRHSGIQEWYERTQARGGA